MHHSDDTKIQNLLDFKSFLFLKVMQDNWQKAWISPLRFDKTMEEDMFIAGITLQSGDIGILIPTKFWDLAVQTKARRLETAPKLEANTAAETLKRISLWIGYARKANSPGTTSFQDFYTSISKARENKPLITK
jgi:hypothetical protein